MREVLRYSNCFVCGDKNEHGLKAKFFYDEGVAACELVASESFEGYRGIFHGGVVSALLDEVMIKAILARNRYAVTAEMTVRYHAPVKVGDRLKFVGKVVREKGRVFITSGEVTNDKGDILASASGKYIEAKSDLRDQLIKSIDD